METGNQIQAKSIHTDKLGPMTDLELLRLHSSILDELTARKVVRSKNNPIADYAEHLVSEALSLSLERRARKGYDATDASGRRYEIKARRENPKRKTTLTSPLRDLDGEHFDELVVVLFAEDYTVKKAIQFPRRLVRDVGRFVKHVNGWVIPLRDSLWNARGCTDITDRIRQAQAHA